MDSDSQNDVASVSKSARKRQAQALQVLGQRLIALKPAQLESIPLSARLREAIEDAKRITQRIARKREMQYVGKLLREVEVESIEAALAALEATGVTERLRHHRLERWRDRLIEGGDPAIQALVETHPAADRPRLRRLVMTARREAERERPPAAARQLFQVLREMDLLRELPEA